MDQNENPIVEPIDAQQVPPPLPTSHEDQEPPQFTPPVEPADGVPQPAPDEPAAEPSQPAVDAPQDTPEQEVATDAGCSCPGECDCAAVQAMIAEMQSRLNALDAKFDEKIYRDGRKDEMFDKLYVELERYRKDIYSKMLKPLITGLVMFLDDLNRTVERIEGKDDAGERALTTLKEHVPEDLLDLLMENGVEPYCTEGDVFDPHTQRSMSVENTADPALDKHIAKRLRSGYRWNGTTLRPETVVIYKYVAPQPGEAPVEDAPVEEPAAAGDAVL